MSDQNQISLPEDVVAVANAVGDHIKVDGTTVDVPKEAVKAAFDAVGYTQEEATRHGKMMNKINYGLAHAMGHRCLDVLKKNPKADHVTAAVKIGKDTMTIGTDRSASVRAGVGKDAELKDVVGRTTISFSRGKTSVAAAVRKNLQHQAIHTFKLKK